MQQNNIFEGKGLKEIISKHSYFENMTLPCYSISAVLIA
jgi:hypothetical protein